MKSKLLQNETATPMRNQFVQVSHAAETQRKKAIEPEVGIFWVYDGRLLVDATPVSRAEPYGTFKSHGRGHPSIWATLQHSGIVPRDVEYDEVPRGRVGYDTRERKFHVFVDPCIRKSKRMMDRIQRDLHLPSKETVVSLDPHYKCPTCQSPQKSKKQLQQQEKDWDF